MGETSITTLSANSATVRDPLSDDKLDVATKLKYVTSFGAARYDQTVGGTTFDVSIPYVLGNGQNESGTINFNIASTAKYKQAEALQYVSSSLGTATGWKKEVGPPGSGVTNYYIDIPVTITKNGGSTPETHRALFNKVYNEIFALGQQGSSSQYEAGYIAGWAKAASLMQMNLDANMTRGCKVKMFGPPSSISSSQEGETASA